MTLDELIQQIQSSGADSIAVECTRIVTGNTDQSGNYKIVKLGIGGRSITFNDKSGKWAAVTTP